MDTSINNAGGTQVPPFYYVSSVKSESEIEVSFVT